MVCGRSSGYLHLSGEKLGGQHHIQGVLSGETFSGAPGREVGRLDMTHLIIFPSGNQSLITTTPITVFEREREISQTDATSLLIFYFFPHYVTEPRRGIQQQIITKYFSTTDGHGFVSILVAKWEERNKNVQKMGLKTHTKIATMPGPTWCQVTEQKFASITYFRWVKKLEKEKRQKTVF